MRRPMSQAVPSVRGRRLIESYLLNVAWAGAGALATPPPAESQQRRSAEDQDSELKPQPRAVGGGAIVTRLLEPVPELAHLNLNH